MSGMHDYCISPECDGKFRRAYYTKVNGSMTKCRSCWESEKHGQRQTRTDVPNPRAAPKEDNVETDDKSSESTNLDDALLELAKRAEKAESEPDYLESEDGSGEEDNLREGEDNAKTSDEDGMADGEDTDDPQEDDWWKPDKPEAYGEDEEAEEGEEGEGEGGSSDAEDDNKKDEDAPLEMPQAIEEQIDNLVQLCDGRYVRMTHYQEDNKNLNIRFEAIEESRDLLKDRQESLKTDIVQQVEEITATIRPVQVTIQGGSREPGIVSGIRHKMFDPVLQIASLGINQMLVGPAGSGKTTLAAQVAQALNLEFYFTGALQTKYDIIGFIDGNGIYHRTAFRNAYENGGVFLWDEIDSSDARAMVAFNSALENDSADFPDGNVKRHPDFISIASANTYGRGADRMYIGRNHLDAATLDRFVSVELDYDEELESKMLPQDAAVTLWVMQVQRVRENVRNLKLKELISPRASINGSKMLMAGMDKEFVKRVALFKGMDYETVDKVSVGVF